MADTGSPYTFTDGQGARLVVDGQMEMVYVYCAGVGSTGVDLPTGEDAAEFARAVLASAGDTGHRVISEASLDEMIDAFAKAAAKDMRNRSYEAAYNAPGTPYTPTEAIRALPLLPDTEDTTEAQDQPTSESDAARMLSEIRARSEQYREQFEGLGYAPDVPLLRAQIDQGRDDREALLDMVDHLREKHSEALNLAMERGERMVRAEAKLRHGKPSVHGATPEGITPCGEGHADVTVDALISDITCVECLRAIAVDKGQQAVELRNERDDARELLAATIPQPNHADTPAGRAVADWGNQAVIEGALSDAQARRDAAVAEGAERSMSTWVGHLERRVEFLELADRERRQSGGAPRAQVAGGYAEA